MQYFTGSKAHNIALRDRAIQRGLKLNEYGLFRVDDDARVAGETEEGDLRGARPGMDRARAAREPRRDRGGASTARCRAWSTVADLRGDLHMHTTATDGRDDLEAMAAAAQRAGPQYIAITDHSKALAMANGLDEQRALEHAARVRALNGRFEGLTLLAGIECDILADGRLDLADDCLAQLDLVVASVHSHFSQDEAQMTDRLLRALECPWVDVLGHPTGRLLLKREPAAHRHGRRSSRRRRGTASRSRSTARSIASTSTTRTPGSPASAASSLVISTDAHSVAALDHLRWGVQMARRAWAAPTTSSTRGARRAAQAAPPAPEALTWRRLRPGSCR